MAESCDPALVSSAVTGAVSVQEQPSPSEPGTQGDEDPSGRPGKRNPFPENDAVRAL